MPLSTSATIAEDCWPDEMHQETPITRSQLNLERCS